MNAIKQGQSSATQALSSQMIEQRIDKAVAGQISISRDSGGVVFRNAMECMEFAKLMAISGEAVPKHLRGRPGVCLGIVIQAIEWRMSPIAVAAKSYVVNDMLAYESQLIHAVIEQRAPIIGRLRHDFRGEGPKRRCRVWARVKNEDQPLEYTSPEFASIQPQNSPLWKTKPDLQLYYNTSRDWARVYFPDVLLGVYAVDELEVITSQKAEHPRTIAVLTRQLQQAHQEEQLAAEPDQQPATAGVESEQEAAADAAETQQTGEGGELDAADTGASDSGESGRDAAWWKYLSEMSAASTLSETIAAYERHFGPESSLSWSAEDDEAAAKVRDQRMEDIRAKRGGKRSQADLL